MMRSLHHKPRALAVLILLAILFASCSADLPTAVPTTVSPDPDSVAVEEPIVTLRLSFRGLVGERKCSVEASIGGAESVVAEPWVPSEGPGWICMEEPLVTQLDCDAGAKLIVASYPVFFTSQNQFVGTTVYRYDPVAHRIEEDSELTQLVFDAYVAGLEPFHPADPGSVEGKNRFAQEVLAGRSCVAVGASVQRG